MRRKKHVGCLIETITSANVGADAVPIGALVNPKDMGRFRDAKRKLRRLAREIRRRSRRASCPWRDVE